MKTIVFACVHNAGRSQMAAFFFNQLCDPSTARAVSAGTQPAGQVHPEVIEAMREVGIDLGRAYPTLLTEELLADAHLLVTMGCGEECPVALGVRRLDWPLRDPKGRSASEVKEIRDEIHALVEALLSSEKWQRPLRSPEA